MVESRIESLFIWFWYYRHPTHLALNFQQATAKAWKKDTVPASNSTSLVVHNLPAILSSPQPLPYPAPPDRRPRYPWFFALLLFLLTTNSTTAVIANITAPITTTAIPPFVLGERPEEVELRSIARMLISVEGLQQTVLLSPQQYLLTMPGHRVTCTLLYAFFNF